PKRVIFSLTQFVSDSFNYCERWFKTFGFFSLRSRHTILLYWLDKGNNMNELDEYCDDIEINFSQPELQRLGWDDKEWMVELAVFVWLMLLIVGLSLIKN
ncbi:hypothetical protein, partial [Vibrio paucivorans]